MIKYEVYSLARGLLRQIVIATDGTLLEDGSTMAREDAKLCGGNCTECAITDGGCWTAKHGEQVVFNEH